MAMVKGEMVNGEMVKGEMERLRHWGAGGLSALAPRKTKYEQESRFTICFLVLSGGTTSVSSETMRALGGFFGRHGGRPSRKGHLEKSPGRAFSPKPPRTARRVVPAIFTFAAVNGMGSEWGRVKG